jgi:hypothetical protein
MPIIIGGISRIRLASFGVVTACCPKSVSVPMAWLVMFLWGILMSKRKLWYGYLEAGKKSSPVIIDRNMDTGEKDTLFIYNHNKQQINKYVRELVEPKLRELTAKEKEMESTLKKGFTAALKTMTHKVSKSFDATAIATVAAVVASTQEEPEMEFSDVGDDDWDDSDD